MQLIVATHSPLVMASAEPRFDAQQDAWFDLDLMPSTAKKEASVQLTQREFERLGDVSRWLVSDAFDLERPSSHEAEVLVTQAETMVQDKKATAAQAEELTRRLEGVLGPVDPFWPRWRMAGAKRGWWPPVSPAPVLQADGQKVKARKDGVA